MLVFLAVFGRSWKTGVAVETSDDRDGGEGSSALEGVARPSSLSDRGLVSSGRDASSLFSWLISSRAPP